MNFIETQVFDKMIAMFSILLDAEIATFQNVRTQLWKYPATQ